MRIDATDRQILELLQSDSSRSLRQIAAMVELSANPCWRRIRRLEAAGVIERRVALLDADKLGVSALAFITVRTDDPGEETSRRLVAAATCEDEVVELYRVTGGDFLIKARLADIAAYDRLHRCLADIPLVIEISATFALETIKHTTAIPLGTMSESRQDTA